MEARGTNVWLRAIALGVVSATMLSCTYSEPRIRAEPGLFFPRPSLDDRLANRFLGTQVSAYPDTDGLKIYCAEWQAPVFNQFLEMFSDTRSSRDECIFVTVDATTLKKFSDPPTSTPSAMLAAASVPAAIPSPTPREIYDRINELLRISDHNCDQYLSEVFSVKAGAEFFRSLVSNSLTSTSAVMALAGPGAAAAGLSVGNLVIGNATNAMEAQYVTRTFDVMEAAIRNRRAIREAAIEARLDATLGKPKAAPAAPAQQTPSPSATPYRGLSDALLDWQEYDRICSLQYGLILVSDAVQKQAPTPTPSPGAGGGVSPAEKPAQAPEQGPARK